MDVILYLDRERWIQCSLAKKNANVKRVLDQMNQKLHNLAFCVIFFAVKLYVTLMPMYQFRL